MTAFDATLNVSNIVITKPSENADHLVIAMEVGQLLPTEDGQAVMVPLGTFRFPISGDKAVRLGNDLAAEGEKMPKPSGLTIASDLSQVESAASDLEALKSKEPK